MRIVCFLLFVLPCRVDTSSSDPTVKLLCKNIPCPSQLRIKTDATTEIRAHCFEDCSLIQRSLWTCRLEIESIKEEREISCEHAYNRSLNVFKITPEFWTNLAVDDVVNLSYEYYVSTKRLTKSLTFTPNHGPSKGKCVIEPKQGKPYVTPFVVTCSDWHDYDGIAGYNYKIKINGGLRNVEFSKSETTVLYLPPADSGEADIIVEIIDNLHAKTVINLNVKLTSADCLLLDEYVGLELSPVNSMYVAADFAFRNRGQLPPSAPDAQKCGHVVANCEQQLHQTTLPTTSPTTTKPTSTPTTTKPTSTPTTTKPTSTPTTTKPTSTPTTTKPTSTPTTTKPTSTPTTTKPTSTPTTTKPTSTPTTTKPTSTPTTTKPTSPTTTKPTSTILTTSLPLDVSTVAPSTISDRQRFEKECLKLAEDGEKIALKWGSCLVLNNKKQTWDEAYESCNRLPNGHLINLIEHDHLEEFMDVVNEWGPTTFLGSNPNYAYLWIGLKQVIELKTSASDVNYRWWSSNRHTLLPKAPIPWGLGATEMESPAEMKESPHIFWIGPVIGNFPLFANIQKAQYMNNIKFLDTTSSVFKRNQKMPVTKELCELYNNKNTYWQHKSYWTCSVESCICFASPPKAASFDNHICDAFQNGQLPNLSNANIRSAYIATLRSTGFSRKGKAGSFLIGGRNQDGSCKQFLTRDHRTIPIKCSDSAGHFCQYNAVQNPDGENRAKRKKRSFDDNCDADAQISDSKVADSILERAHSECNTSLAAVSCIDGIHSLVDTVSAISLNQIENSLLVLDEINEIVSSPVLLDMPTEVVEELLEKTFKFSVLLNSKLKECSVSCRTPGRSEWQKLEDFDTSLSLDEETHVTSSFDADDQWLTYALEGANKNRREHMVDTADDLLHKLVDVLMMVKTDGNLDIVDSSGELKVIETNIDSLNSTTEFAMKYATIIVPAICDHLEDVCNETGKEFFWKIVNYKDNLYDHIGTVNIASVNVSLLVKQPGQADVRKIELKDLKEPVVLSFDINDNIAVETLLTPRTDKYELFQYHHFTTDYPDTLVLFEMNKTDGNATLVLLMNEGDSLPWPTNFTSVKTFPDGLGNLTWSVILKSKGKHHLGIGQVIETKANETVTFAGYNFLQQMDMNYTLSIRKYACLFKSFDPRTETFFWDTTGCSVQNTTTKSRLVCACKHFSVFSGDAAIVPNSIEFEYLFDSTSFPKNISIYTTLIILYSIYILCIIWGYRQDRKAQTPLLISLVKSETYYQYKVTIVTGVNSHAGTDSNVWIMLFGSKSQSNEQNLYTFEKKTKCFHRGRRVSFLISNKRHLGDLHHCCVWHDNSGLGLMTDWYLKSIHVTDLTSGKRYKFICNQWLSAERGDQKTRRTLSLNSACLSAGNYSLRMEEILLENYLWLSIPFGRSQRRFTHCQQLSCCFSLVLTSILASAMWYDKMDEGTSSTIDFGPFKFSWTEVVVGFLSSLVVLPINFVAVYLFKISKKTQAKSSKFSMVWFRYLAWLIVLLTICISTFFVLAYAIQFGDPKTRKWLWSFVTGILESVLLIQPLTVLSGTALIATICKKTEQYYTSNYKNEESNMLKNDGDMQKVDAIMNLKKLHKKKELEMNTLCRELSYTLGFVFLVTILVLTDRDGTSFYLKDQLKKTFLNPLFDASSTTTSRDKPVLVAIRRYENFWRWANNVLAPELRAKNYYNGEMAFGEIGFIGDHANRLIGTAIMRQIRRKRGQCNHSHMKKYFRSCASHETESGHYGIGWNPIVSQYRPEYQFNSIYNKLTMPTTGIFGIYGSGGHIVSLHKSVSKMQKRFRELEKEGWIDANTRAIIIQFTVYNTAMRMFSVNKILFEQPPIGGLFLSYYFQPIRLLRHDVQAATVLYILEFIFLLLTLNSIREQCINWYRDGFVKFIKSWNNSIELGVIIVSAFAIVLYFLRLKEASDLVEQINQTKGNSYINFDYAADIEKTFGYMLGALSALNTFKLVRLLRFNKKVSVMADTLNRASTELISIGMTAALYLFSFSVAFYLLVGDQYIEMSSVLRSCAKLIAVFVHQFRFWDVAVIKPLAGSFIIAAYFFGIVVLLNSIFVATLNAVTHATANDSRLQTNDYEIMQFAWNKVFGYVSRNRHFCERVAFNELEFDVVQQYETLEQKSQMFSNIIDRFIHPEA